MLTLITLNGQEKGREFQLTGEQPELMGRQASKIKLTDTQTSRRHAEVLLENNTWLIRDLGSTNGTWVNGQKITQITELESGDRIVLGRHQFRIGKITDAPAPSPQPQPPDQEPVIGSEELAAMGVDLGESLSADLLEGEDLPALPEDSFDDEAGVETLPPDGAQAPADGGPVKQADDDDDILDLDALLGDFGHDAGEPEVSDQPKPPSTSDKAAPESTPDQADSSPVPKEPDGLSDPLEPDGLIDLDALLREKRETADEPLDPEQETAGLPDSTADSSPIDYAALMDLKADSSSPQDLETSPEEPDDSADTPPQDPATRPPEPTAAQPPEVSEAAQSTEETQPPKPAGHAESDDLIDFDILASAPPTAIFQPGDQTPSEEADLTTDAPVEPITQSTDPPLPDQPDDERVDPATDGLSEPDEPEEPSTDPPSVPDLDDQLVAADDLEDDDQDVEQADALEQDELAPAEMALMMTPDDQADALVGYKRSRFKTLMLLVVIFAGLGAAGWYKLRPQDNVETATSTASIPPTNESIDTEAVHPPPQPEQIAAASIPGPRDSAESAAPTASIPPDESNDTEAVHPLPEPDLVAAPSTPGLPGSAEPAAPTASSPPTEAPLADLVPLADISPKASTPSAPPAAPDFPDSPVQAPDLPQDVPIAKAETSPSPDAPRASPSSPMADLISPRDASGNTQTPQASESQTAMTDIELDILFEEAKAQHQARQGVPDQTAFANARRVAFIVDASGSLIDSFPYLLAEVGVAVSKLPKKSAFTIIFFGTDGAVEVPPAGLRWASPENKRGVRKWVAPASGNISAWGRGDPAQAIQKALTYKVDEIFIFSDNLFGQRLSSEKAKVSVSRIVGMLEGEVQRVHIIQLFDRDPHQVLKQIAEALDGRYEQIEPQIETPPPSGEPSSDP